jgi:hypothetical protein
MPFPIDLNQRSDHLAGASKTAGGDAMTRFPYLPCALLMTVAISAASVGLAQASSPPTTDPLAANAALYYWRAFAMASSYDEKQLKAVSDAVMDLKPVDDGLEKIVRESEPIVRELGRAARQPRCVWGTPFEDGVAVQIPHVGKARQVAKVVLASARWDFHRGDPAKGADALIATMTLARNIGNDRIVVAVLVGYTIERMAEDVAVADMDRMGPAALKQLAERLDRLPPATTLRQAVIAERDLFLEPMIRDLSKPGAKKMMEKLFADAKEMKVLKDLSEEQILEGAIGMRPLYEKFAAMMELPPSEIKQAEDKILADPNLSGPTRTMARLFAPAFVPMAQQEVNHNLRLALLRAAIGVQQQGEKALRDPACLDPLAKAAFQYEKTSRGFRLQSKTPNPQTGKPIALETGKGLER